MMVNVPAYSLASDPYNSIKKARQAIRTDDLQLADSHDNDARNSLESAIEQKLSKLQS